MPCVETESGWLRDGTIPWYRRLLQSHPQNLGSWGEWLALHHLRDLGWDIVARNWKCGRGELDLIAYDGPYLVFVEVKTRSDTGPTALPAEDNFTTEKARQVESLAIQFCLRHHLSEVPTRFDLIAIETADLEHFELRHYFLPASAFGEVGDG